MGQEAPQSLRQTRGFPLFPDNWRSQQAKRTSAVPARRLNYEGITDTENWTTADPYLVREQGTTREWLLQNINSLLDAPLVTTATITYGEGNAKRYTGIFPNLKNKKIGLTTALQLFDTFTLTSSDLKLLGKYKRRRKRGDTDQKVDNLKQRIIYYAQEAGSKSDELLSRLYQIIGTLLDPSVPLAQRQEQGIEALFKELEEAASFRKSAVK